MLEHNSSRTLLVRGVAFAVSFATLSAAACSDSTGINSGTSSQLAFTTGAGTASSASFASIPITKDGHTLDVTAATVVVTRASLKRSTSDVCGADDEDDHGEHHPGRGEHGRCGEVRLGPTLVDLPLDGKLVTIPGNTIPPGTYRDFDVRISLVRLQGTYDTKAFDVTIPVEAKTGISFDPPLVVEEDSAVAVTVNLPVDTWLVRSDGTLIDPTTLLSTPSQLALVRKKISASIRAFEDRDHNGRDDHKHD